MADEPRRSGRATKGQHKNASSSPGPGPGPAPVPVTKNGKAAAATMTKGKPTKKSTEPEPEDDDDENDKIRCICGNDNPKDRRAFIGCDACTVWQHNVCMGMPIEEDDVPDHYFCEDCRPDEHAETVQAMSRGEKIWETRNRIWQNEKKSKSRKSRGGEEAKPGWLKKDIMPEEPVDEVPENVVESQETGVKRNYDEMKSGSPAEDVQEEKAEEMPKRPSRQEKRRKSSTVPTKQEPDTDTALVNVDQLPADRQKVAVTLSKLIAADVSERVLSSFQIPEGRTPKSLGDHHAARIEYALHMHHGGQPNYRAQFLALNANLKKNKMLIERLINGSLTADDLAIMDTKDMASEELQRERAELKKELDRQATAIEEESGPIIRRTHKGDEIIENEAHVATDMAANPQPVRERTSEGNEGAGSPTNASAQGLNGSSHQNIQPLAVDTKVPFDGFTVRRTSSQQFDMKNIWAKTAQSPPATRPMQLPPRRRSSVQIPSDQADGAKHDPDVDRMLEDDEAYSPADYTGDDSIVWRGRLVQGEGEPTVNARFVAGRNLNTTVPWNDLLPDKLHIDGRLAIQKAEEYLCGLQWSSNSDVSVLALAPYDDAEAFNTLFDYFHSRQRYAVVGPKYLPSLIKDLYIVPLEVGNVLPEHIEKLDMCKIKTPVEDRMLLATFVVARAPEQPDSTAIQHPNGHGHLPQHLRDGGPGPAGSPIAPQTPVFNNPGAFPPNPYGTPSNHLIGQILGELQFCPTAQGVVSSDPQIDRAKLENLRRILDLHPAARTDITVLAALLSVGP